MPGGGSLVAANYVYGVAKPDGLTMVMPNSNVYLEQLSGHKEVRFDLRKFPILGSQEKNYMTRNPITVKRNTPIIDAVSKILSKRINCLPVVEDDGSVCGIVTSTDLLKSYLKLLELVQKQAR